MRGQLDRELSSEAILCLLDFVFAIAFTRFENGGSIPTNGLTYVLETRRSTAPLFVVRTLQILSMTLNAVAAVDHMVHWNCDLSSPKP